jgi:hypothetical protein
MNCRSLSDIQTRAELRREFEYQIKIGRECFNVIKKRPILYEFIGEVILKINKPRKSNLSLCKSGQIFIRFTNID